MRAERGATVVVGEHHDRVMRPAAGGDHLWVDDLHEFCPETRQAVRVSAENATESCLLDIRVLKRPVGEQPVRVGHERKPT